MCLLAMHAGASCFIGVGELDITAHHITSHHVYQAGTTLILWCESIYLQVQVLRYYCIHAWMYRTLQAPATSYSNIINMGAGIPGTDNHMEGFTGSAMV
jgi:hypothetical protein